MNRLLAATAAILMLAACSSGPSEEEVRADYVDLLDDFTTALNAAAANPITWETSCNTLNILGQKGIALPDLGSDEFNNEWDAAMEAYIQAGSGDITDCTAAMDVATAHITAAASLIGT